MKALRWIVLGIILLSLPACGVFLAPPLGRWNLADPNNEVVEKEIPITVDGYIDETDFKDFTVMNLNVSGTLPKQKTLLQFDAAQIPEGILRAELQLYSNFGSSTVQVRLILQTWDPLSPELTWAKINSSGFDSELASPPVTVMSPAWMYFDVTKLLQGANPTSVHGLLVEAVMPPIINCSANESGANKPLLVVWYPKPKV